MESLLRLIRYYRHLISHRSLADYIDMGMGIEARYERAREYWSPHLQLCKGFQQNHISGPVGSVGVYGAGRLYDLHLALISNLAERIILYDADPSCYPLWEKAFQDLPAGLKVAGEITDLTGVIAEWTERIDQFFRGCRARDDHQLRVFLMDFPRPDVTEHEQVDVAISLNLLSQIPIYWKERLAVRLKRRWGVVPDQHDTFPEEIQRGIEYTMRLLQRQHLDFLERIAKERIILFADTCFLYYQADRSEWQEEPALYIEGELSFAGFRQEACESWLWHIAPQGVEYADFGSLHEVSASVWIRDTSSE